LAVSMELISLVVRLTLSIFPAYPFAIVLLLPDGSPVELPIGKMNPWF